MKKIRKFCKHISAPIKLFVALSLIVISYRAADSYQSSTERYVRDRVVMLTGENGLCSGINVEAPSGKSYILSAAHCAMLKDDNGKITVIREDHTNYRTNIVEVDVNADLMLLASEDSGIQIKSDPVRQYESVWTLTHGGGMPTYRTDGVVLKATKVQFPEYQLESDEDVTKCLSTPNRSVTFMGIMLCVVSYDEVITTARAIPGSSGGAVLDSKGQLMGIVSATDGSNLFSYIVSQKDIHRFMQIY